MSETRTESGLILLDDQPQQSQPEAEATSLIDLNGQPILSVVPIDDWKAREDHLKTHMVTVRSTIQKYTVEPCGHELDPAHEPRMSNCEHCWNGYFRSSPALVQAMRELFDRYPDRMMRNKFGKKYVKQIKRFLGLI